MEKLIKRLIKEDIGISINSKNELELSYDSDYIDGNLLEEITKHKQELIQYLRRFHNKTPHKISQVVEKTKYKASLGQKRIWMLSQFKEGSVAYNLSNLRDIGHFEITKFKKALDYLIHRHEILRTVFKIEEDGELYQYISKVHPVDSFFEYKDYRDKSNEQIKEEIKQYAKIPFDLAQGPLFKVYIFQTDSDRYMMYYNMHHIISDGWSLEVIQKDLMFFYEALVAGTEINKEKLSIQYKDYSSWQLESIENGSFDKEKKYWTEHLKGDFPLLNLSSNTKRPEIKTFNGKKLQTIINIEATNEIKSFVNKYRGSIYSFLLTTWNILLYKYTGEKEFIVGVPVAGRGIEELENQIGFYVNTIPLKNNINSEDTFLETFKRISENMLEGISNQMYPLDRIIEDLGVNKDVSRNPLFDILLTYQSIRKMKLESSQEKALENMKLDKTTTKAKLDLDIDFLEHQNYITFEVTYNTDIFQEGFVRKLISHFKQLIDSILKTPDSDIKKIDFLSSEEKIHQLKELNNTQKQFDLDKTIVEVFREQVNKTPNAIAISFKNESITFKELDRKSNYLAHELIRKGVEKEDLVPICIDKNIEMVIGILAVLKSGGAYVPVDPNYPKERLDFIIEDTNSSFILSSSNFKSIVGRYDSKNIIYLDEKLEIVPEDNWDSPKTEFSTNNLAYVIYTSGSTGKPKGVKIEHKSLMNFLFSMSDYFTFNQNLKFLSLTTFTFDISILELLSPLLSGGKLILVGDKESKDPEQIIDIINTTKPNCIQATPSRWQMLMTSGWNNNENITLLSGGESIDYELKERLTEVSNKVWNLYGPTETTIWSCISRLEKGKKINIGKPIANTDVYILDEHLSLIPQGMVGQLCIGGLGLSRGYLNRPNLTSEKFIPHPFKKEEHLYLTGDLARWSPDGTIEFLGRNDHQVKINGYRIEMGEIESALIDIDNIQQAVVLAIKNSGVKQLVGYLVSEEEIDQQEIQSILMHKLPEYMVPRIYVKLEKMPLTHNDKINRKVLPLPVLKQDYVAPSNQIEKVIAELWGENLNIEKIGVNDNFFRLGGDSLKAIRINLEINSKFNIDFEMSELFKLTTIKKLSEAIISKQQNEKETQRQIVDKITI